jgi:Tfp pilus assembly protein PilV
MMLARPRRPARRGLSLLEVILSLTILLLAMVAIGKLVESGTDRGASARAQIRGTRLAQSKMAEVEAGLIPLSSSSTGTGPTSGQFEGDDAAWSFQVTPEPAGPPNLYTVTVTVSRDMQGIQYQVVLSQMMFDPSLMGSAAQAEWPATDDTSGTGSGMGTTGTGGP